MGEGRGGGITCFWSWLSWAERLSMRTRDCCSSSWAAPIRLLFLSADCLALSSWRGGHRVRAAATKGRRDLRRASLLQRQGPGTLSSCHRPPDLPQDISGWAGGGLLGAEAAREPRDNEHLGRIGLLQFLLVYCSTWSSCWARSSCRASASRLSNSRCFPLSISTSRVSWRRLVSRSSWKGWTQKPKSELVLQG